MKPASVPDEKSDFYRVERRDDVAILRLGKNFLFEAIEVALHNPLLDVVDDISKNDDISVVVIINCAEKTGGDDYACFCRQTIDTEFDYRSIHRMCNFFDQLILKIFGLNKVVVHADCGEIIPLFFNLSLACDYRIIATHTIYLQPYCKEDLLPKGGGTFFLCNMLGYDRTRKLLMSDQNLTAHESLELGIVDQVVPQKQLEETAVQIALSFAAKQTRALASLKRLIGYSMKDLRDYLNFENQEIMRMIRAPA